ncbi:MAG: serine/threonine-protein kinase [Anaerolineae bacterium]
MAMLIASRYEIGEPIGDGGMGTVYKGLDTRTKQPVAIKHLKPEVIALEPEIVERFRREGQALRQLNHPNIVKVLAMTKEGKSYYLILEYVSGGSLANLLRTQQILPLERILSIALELSDALARAHHLKIIHRDLKPGNVLLANDGTPRLTDFGIAHLGDRSRLTGTQTVMGTLGYLSPEALDGKPLDPRADIWSFGVILYEMLTGKLPFNDPTASAMMMSIVHKSFPSLQELRPDIPPALITLIQRMLEKDPAQRIASVRLVGAELQAIMQGGQSVLIAPPTAPSEESEENLLFMVVQRLNADLIGLAQKWEKEARDAETRGAKPTLDRQTAYFHRGTAKGLSAAAAELRSLIETTGKESAAPTAPPQIYAPVTRKEAATFLENVGMKVSYLYEDKGYIFTAIFPKLPLTSIDDRIRKMREMAPGIVIVEAGKLPDTGEPYIDFAFNEPPL